MYWFKVLIASATLVAPMYAEGIQQDSPLPTSESPLLPWSTDFDKALASAKSDSVPLYVYFTGSSWCIWCKKMDREIHNQDAFRQKTVGKLLFVKIDLPAGTQPSEGVKNLIEKYKVNGVPTVVILSPSGDELGRFRYQQMPPEEYADAVLQVATSRPVTSQTKSSP
jgi:protein disulfide-isomerase